MRRSLTSHLSDPKSQVRQFFETRLPNTKAIMDEARNELRNAVTIRPDGQLPWSTIGIAFDYRARYCFHCGSPTELLAYRGAWDLAAYLASESPGFQLDAVLVQEFFDRLAGDLDSIAPKGRALPSEADELLARYCLVLALFDEFARAGSAVLARTPLRSLSADAEVDELLTLAAPAEVTDLCLLTQAFCKDNLALFSKPAVCNPHFPSVGDAILADADLIIDGLLTDLKCTITPLLKSDHIWQLAGYLLLDQDDEYHVTSVGFYMARQRRWLRWAASDFVTRLSEGVTTVHSLRTDFRVILEAERADARGAHVSKNTRRFTGSSTVER